MLLICMAYVPTLEGIKGLLSLYPEMYALAFPCSGAWRDQEFKAYNFNALGLPPPGGHLHPLLKVGTDACWHRHMCHDR